jgi:DNA-binding CsgD family transcriptional regulator
MATSHEAGDTKGNQPALVKGVGCGRGSATLAGVSALGATFDREVEIAAIARAVDAGGALVYVEGHAGIGKTRLLDLARADAERRGARVLTARGSELERGYGYGVARQLLAAAVAEQAPERTDGGEVPAIRSDSAGGDAEALARAALGVGPQQAQAPPDSPFAILDGLWRLTAALAAERPLVLVLDDAHWADAPTLRFAEFLAGRLDGLAVTVVVAARPVEPAGEDDAVSEAFAANGAGGVPEVAATGADAAELLARLRDGHGARLVRPAPLGEEAAAALLRERCGREPSGAFAAACHRASGGNPFLLHALVGELLRDGADPAGEDTTVVGDSGPETVARSLRLRLARLPAGCATVLDAVAALGDDAEIRHVAAVAGIDAERVGTLADRLADADLLAAARPLRFAHPVVRQAAYARQRPAARAALHRRAAAALTAEDRPPQAIAAHLLLVDPAGDAQVVALLRAAAAEALAQGAADIALPQLRRALREPPTRAATGALLAELGHAETLVGELADAEQHLATAAAATSDPRERAERLRGAARTRLHRGDLAGAIELLERAGVGADPETVLRLTAHAAAIGLLHPPLATAALERLERAAGRLDVGRLGATRGGVGDLAETPAGLAALAELAGARWLDGRIEEGAALALRALAGDRLLEAEGPGSIVVNHALRVLVDADEHERARPSLDAALALARRQGSVVGLVSLLGVAQVSAWRRGDVHEAEALGRELLELAPPGMPKLAHWALLALALVERGELDAAEEAVERSGAGPQLPPLTHVGVAFHARARLRLAQGRPRDALLDLLELRARDERLGVGHLSVAWHRTAVEAALADGDADAARAFAREQLARAERWSSPSGRGLALSTAGLAHGGEEGIAQLAEGAELLGASPARLDHARALTDLGTALRRAGRPAQAREPLRAALDAATACGASALASRAHEELRIAGAKPRRLRFSGHDALTAAERRVARMAAGGHSNREIAAALSIALRTVENHLARTYRKLGIGSRRELPAALADPHESG